MGDRDPARERVALALSIAPAVPALAGTLVPGRAGSRLEAALVVALVALSAVAWLWGRAPRPAQGVAAALAAAIVLAAIDVRILSASVASTVSGEPYGRVGVVQVLVLGPVAEELIYRGVLWRALARRGAGLAATLAVTSLAFGAYHLAYWAGRTESLVPPLVHLTGAAVAGLLLGVVRWWTGRVSVPAFVHCAMNTTVLALRMRA